MARKKNVSIKMENISGVAYSLKMFPEKAISELTNVMGEWGQHTKSEYDALTGYGSGFSHSKYGNEQSFSIIKRETRRAGLMVAVGHECFIARFLEVGTKAHTISHKKDGKIIRTVNVRGIKGSKALAKAINRNIKEVPRRVEKAIKNLMEREV